MAVYRLMNARKKLLMLAICTVGIGACANTQHAEREQHVKDIAQTIGCAEDEVAFCVETNCEPEEYVCTNRGDVREMFKAGEFRH